jgi:hypothetical protein
MAETKKLITGQQKCHRPHQKPWTGSDDIGHSSRQSAGSARADSYFACCSDCSRNTACIGSQSVTTCTGNRSATTCSVNRSTAPWTGKRTVTQCTVNRSSATWPGSCCGSSWTGSREDTITWTGSRSANAWCGKRGLFLSLLLVGICLPVSLAVPKGKKISY